MAFTISNINFNGPTSAPIGPLSSLYTNKYTKNLFQYPRDLGSSYKGHSVRFDFVEVESVGVEQAFKSIEESLDKISKDENVLSIAKVAATSAGVGAIVGTIAGAKAGAVAGSITAGVMAYKNLDGQKVLGAVETVAGAIGGVSSTNLLSDATSGSTTGIQISPSKTRTGDSVELYMPETLEFSYESSYSDLSVAEAVGQSRITGSLGQAITSIVEDPLAKLALNRAGYVFNPQQQLLFNGIDFRTYQMTFTFTPYSQSEADSVQNIIKTFRKYAAPTVVTESGGFFFTPPGMVDIRFLMNGAENTKLHKLKRCVLESVSVNYAPNGWTAMEDGAPAQSTMTLSFKEMQLVDRKDILKGY